jgi:hypothetical protein
MTNRSVQMSKFWLSQKLRELLSIYSTFRLDFSLVLSTRFYYSKRLPFSELLLYWWIKAINIKISLYITVKGHKFKR